MTLQGRPRVVTISGQEVLTADTVSIKLSVVMQIAIEDARAAYMKAENFEETLYSHAQIALREHVAATPIEELMAARGGISAHLGNDVSPIAA